MACYDAKDINEVKPTPGKGVGVKSPPPPFLDDKWKTAVSSTQKFSERAKEWKTHNMNNMHKMNNTVRASNYFLSGLGKVPGRQMTVL